MTSWWLAMPRATIKARLWAALYSLLMVWLVWQQWPHVHDELAIARWIAWFFVGSAVVYLPQVLIIVIFARVPKVYQRMGQGLFKTPSSLYRENLEEIRERQSNSRLL